MFFFGTFKLLSMIFFISFCFDSNSASKNKLKLKEVPVVTLNYLVCFTVQNTFHLNLYTYIICCMHARVLSVLLFAIHLSLNILFECKSICTRYLINRTAFLRISELRFFFITMTHLEKKSSIEMINT